MSWIYKYEFEPNDYVDVPLSQDAKILHVDEQNRGRLTIWAEMDESVCCNVRLLVRETGQDAPAPFFDYIGTVVMRSGLVWHVYGPKGCKR